MPALPMWSSSPVHIHGLSSTHRRAAMHQAQPLALQASHERWPPHGTSGSRTPPPPAAAYTFSDTFGAHDQSNGLHRHTHQPAPALAGGRVRLCTARCFCCLPLFAGGLENAERKSACSPPAHSRLHSLLTRPRPRLCRVGRAHVAARTAAPATCRSIFGAVARPAVLLLRRWRLRASLRRRVRERLSLRFRCGQHQEQRQQHCQRNPTSHAGPFLSSAKSGPKSGPVVKITCSKNNLFSSSSVGLFWHYCNERSGFLRFFNLRQMECFE